MKDNTSDEKSTVIQGPWKPKEEIMLEEKVDPGLEELSRIGRCKDVADDFYRSYRNRMYGATVLIGEASLLAIDALTDLSPVSYMLMAPAALMLGRYLTKETRQRWREQRARLSRLEDEILQRGSE